MRNLPGDIAAKLSMSKQTKANNSDPWAQIFITRPTVPLTNQMFLERSVVADLAATDVSIAVCHPRRHHSNTDVWVAYAGTDGTITVSKSPTDEKCRWTRYIHSLPGTKVCIAFDGDMPMDDKYQREFVTETEPWLFWVDNGALYSKKIGTDNITTLALDNVSDVSAVRATWSEIGRFDFGLCAFFVMNGSLYYRQLIDGEWKDAETVTFGLDGLTITEVSANRTWDYRLALQIKTSDNAMHELYSQYMGFGTNNAENINLKRIDGEGELLKIHYINSKEQEHVSIDDVSAEAERQWGLPVIPISISNVDDGTGNRGLYIRVVLGHPCNIETLLDNAASFILSDEWGQNFYSNTITVDSDSIITLGFLDFNSAHGECILSYIPGTIKSPKNNPSINMEAWSESFTPTGLVPPEVDPPEPSSLWNE